MSTTTETMQCDECGEKQYGDYGRWAPAPGYDRVMLVCHDCAEYVRTFATKQEAIDARAKLIAPDPHVACNETIKARERSITDLRYRVRELEKELRDGHIVLWRCNCDRHPPRENNMGCGCDNEYGVTCRERIQEVTDERDEWKAKAEAQQRQREAWQLRAERKDIRISALENATHYCCMHMRWETREGAEV